MIKKLMVLSTPLLLLSHTINFDDALNKTLQMNKGLKAKQLEIKEAQSSYDEAKGYNYGSLVFEENISHTNNAGYVFGMKLASREATFGDFGFNEFDMTGATNPLPVAPEDLNNPDARTNFETKLVYRAPIFVGFKLQNGAKMAKLQVLASKAQYTYDTKQLGLEVLKAYNGAVTAKEFVKATQRAKDATTAFVEFAEALYEEGLVTSIDVKQAQVYDLDVDAKMIEAKNKQALAISYLKFLTSDDTITDVEEFHNININSSSLKSLQDSATQYRDDLQKMKHNTETMKTKIDFDNSYLYPTIGTQLEYGFNDDSFNNINSDHDYYLAALGISYNLFDGAVSSSKAQKTKIQHRKVKYYLEYMKDGIKLEVEKNLLTLQSKTKILNQKKKALNLSDEVLVQSSEMYKNHLIKMSDLLMQQANKQKANAQTIMAKYDETLAAGVLKISLGQSLNQTEAK